MGIFCIWFVVKFASYGWLLFCPFIAAFCGKALLLRFHICMCCQVVLGSILSSNCVLAEPLIQGAITVIFLSWPTTIIPHCLIWLYDKILWTSEPLWQIVEIVGGVELITKFSSDVVDRIDDQPALAKTVLSSVAVVTYGISVCLISSLWMYGNWLCNVILIAVLVILFLIHIWVYCTEQGIISETGFVSLFSVLIVYGLHCEQTTIGNTVEIPLEWHQAAEEITYIKLAWKVLTSSMDSMTHVIGFCSHLFTPWFVMSGLLRITAVLFAIELLHKWYNDREEDDLKEESEDGDYDEDNFDYSTVYTKCTSPLVIRLVVYFVYAQFLIHHIHRFIQSEESYYVTQIFQGTFATGCRLMQITGTLVFYMAKVYNRQTTDDY